MHVSLLLQMCDVGLLVFDEAHHCSWHSVGQLLHDMLK
jgi:hypothetical protein